MCLDSTPSILRVGGQSSSIKLRDHLLSKVIEQKMPGTNVVIWRGVETKILTGGRVGAVSGIRVGCCKWYDQV